MRHFVAPGVRTLVRADGKEVFDHDIKPCDKKLRPSTKCKYPEAGMLYALASSCLRRGNTTREVALGLCRQIGQAKDAEFVYELDLGGRGVANRVKSLAEGYDGVEGADVLHSFIVNSVRELKARTGKKATVIYPGRDVWCWEVLSRKLGMPSLYDSRVSRCVAGREDLLKPIVEAWPIPDWKRTVLFDSGYQGTVPRAIGKAAGLEEMLVVMLSAQNEDEQIFPSHAKARKKALACEYLAKYHKRANLAANGIHQPLAELEEFIKSALLTIWLWYHVSPAKLPSWKDKPAVPTFKPVSGGISFGPSGQNVVQAAHGPTPIISVPSGSAGVLDPNTFQIKWPTNTTGGHWISSTSASTTGSLMWNNMSITNTGWTI